MFEVVILRVDRELLCDEYNFLFSLVSSSRQERVKRFCVFQDECNSLLGDVLARVEVCRVTGFVNGELEFAVNFCGKPFLVNNSLVHFTVNHRYCYDNALLIRMIDEASNALIQGHFTKQQAEIIINALSCISEHFSNAKERFVIVHTDLGKSNIVLQNDILIPIDFSLSGFCIPEMDLASAFSHINDDALNESILNGYKSANNYILDEVGIEACFCLQILLFVVCQHNKFAKELWFGEKLDEWCSNHLSPLIIKS